MKEKGITLIALVIIIIILLILAGIALATLTGENGLITKAQEAKETTKLAEIEEQLRLAQLATKVKKEGGDISINDFLDELGKQGVDFEKEGDNTIIVDDKYVYDLEEKDGEVEWEYKGDDKDPNPPIVPTLKEGDLIFSYTVNGNKIKETDWTQGPVTVTIKPNNINMTNYKIQYTIENPNVESNWQDYTTGIEFNQNGELHVRLYDKTIKESGSKYTKKIANIDTTAPEISKLEATPASNSITVIGTVVEAGSGIEKCEYSIDNGSTWQTPKNPVSTTYTFNDLAQKQTYTITMRVTDKAKNVSEISSTSATTGEVPKAEGNIEISYSNSNWTNGKVNVTFTNISGNNAYKVEYQKDGGEWKEYATPIEMTDNGTIHARLKDSGGNVGDTVTANVTKIDKTVPTITNDSFIVTETTENSIKLEIKATDTVSGLSKIVWYYKKVADSDYKSLEDIYQEMNGQVAGEITEQMKTKTILYLTAGETYELYTEVYDVAGNKTTSDKITKELVKQGQGGGTWTGEVNSPKLKDGMVAVYWDSSNNERTLTESSSTEEWNNWYNYVEGNNATDTKTSKWANAKITKEGVDSYFVWVPRYEYKILSGEGTSTAGKIEVKFIPTTKITPDEGYKIHPAFEDGSETGKNNHFMNGEWDSQLPGIWVGKYETSHSDATASAMGSSNSLQIKPGVPSWRDIAIGDCYTTAYNYDRDRDSHLMKNSEWGAVAYLTHSQYGRNGNEIDINNSSSWITGNGGGSTNATKASGITNAYNTAKGMQASTTGNIYGIYDLSGGSSEYVAGYISNGNANISSYGNSFASATADANGHQTLSTKYVTVYPYNSSSDTKEDNYNVYKNAKSTTYGHGDAILETSSSGSVTSNSWFSDNSEFPYTSRPFFVRGGSYEDGLKTGGFNFRGQIGYPNTVISFRVVLAEATPTESQDNTPPVITKLETSTTTDSITVAGTVTEEGSGIEKCEFSIDNGNTWQVPEDPTSTSYTFSKLTQNQTYTIKMRVTDKAGNVSEISSTSATTGEVPKAEGNIEISYSNSNWTNGKVKVTFTNNLGDSAYRLQYQKNDGEWTDYSEAVEMTANGEVHARLKDSGGNVGAIATANVANIDTTIPTIKDDSLTVTEVTADRITSQVKVTDEESGLSKMIWYYKKVADSSYKSLEEVYQEMNGQVAGETTQQTKTKTISGLTAGETYELYIEVYDVAGNKKQTNPETIKVAEKTISPGDIANSEDKGEYYGTTIEGYECPNSAGVNAWRILYADSSNIYIIADDYIHYDYCPSSKTQTIYKNNTDYTLSMQNVIADYQGSTNITNSKIRALNNDYFSKGYSSTEDNMKAVAYMLDTSVWSGFAGSTAEFAIGGPTMELLCKSHNQKYGTDYRTRANDGKGYEVSKDGGANWVGTAFGGVFTKEDETYVKSSTEKAKGLWVASPHSSSNKALLQINNSGGYLCNSYNNANYGFRPVVCLRSDVQLEEQGNGSYKIKK